MRGRGLAFVAMLAAGPAFAEGPYGAIAYAAPTDTTAVVVDQPSREAAEAAALASCRESSRQPESCAIPLWFVNGCGGLARASDGTWGTGWGTSQEIATEWALNTCASFGGTDCRIKIVACSPDGGGYIPSE